MRPKGSLVWPLVGLQMLAASLFVALCYLVERTDIVSVWGCFYGLFAIYGVSLWLAKDPDEQRVLWVCAVVFRLLVLASVPALSDDVFRFVWDGRLWEAGISPFEARPSEWAWAGIVGTHAAFDPDLYALLYSRDFYASYPPLTQLLFWLSCSLSPGDHVYVDVVAIKLVLVGFDLGVLVLLRRLAIAFGLGERAGLIYALNPVVVVELSGNAHFDAVMIFFVLAAVLLLVRERWRTSAVCLGLAMCVKPFPIVLLPLLVRRLGLKRAAVFGLLSLGVFVLGHVLMLWSPAHLAHYTEGLTRFFRTFEFNASFYYLARWWGYAEYGHNRIAQIGRVLPVLVVVSVLILAWCRRDVGPEDAKLWRFPEEAMMAMTLYWLGALVVHPWYTSSLVAFAALGRLRYPVVWSAMVPLTYIAYASDPYEESMAVVWVEYGVLGLAMLVDWYRHRREAT